MEKILFWLMPFISVALKIRNKKISFQEWILGYGGAILIGFSCGFLLAYTDNDGLGTIILMALASIAASILFFIQMGVLFFRGNETLIAYTSYSHIGVFAAVLGTILRVVLLEH